MSYQFMDVKGIYDSAKERNAVIRKKLQKGATHHQIAEEFGLSNAQILRIKNNLIAKGTAQLIRRQEAFNRLDAAYDRNPALSTIAIRASVSIPFARQWMLHRGISPNKR